MQEWKQVHPLELLGWIINSIFVRNCYWCRQSPRQARGAVWHFGTNTTFILGARKSYGNTRFCQSKGLLDKPVQIYRHSSKWNVAAVLVCGLSLFQNTRSCIILKCMDAFRVRFSVCSFGVVTNERRLQINKNVCDILNMVLIYPYALCKIQNPNQVTTFFSQQTIVHGVAPNFYDHRPAAVQLLSHRTERPTPSP